MPRRRGQDARLVDSSVADFLGLVASTDPAVPAGGSVAALTGAAAAALLALVCKVIEKHRPNTVVDQLGRVTALQQRLVELSTERGTAARRAAAERVVRVPLEIGRACGDIVDLATDLHSYAPASLRQDVSAARALAEAASRSALDIEQRNRVSPKTD